MFCSRWGCRSNAPDRPFAFRWEDTQPPRKSMRLETRLRKLSDVSENAKARMRLLKQLEFIFRDTDSLTSILSLRERRTTKLPGEGDGFAPNRDIDLETKSRRLLNQLGAVKLACELRVEWNPRLQTCAGRAHFPERLISLNP